MKENIWNHADIGGRRHRGFVELLCLPGEHKPKFLSCGHTVCLKCIKVNKIYLLMSVNNGIDERGHFFWHWIQIKPIVWPAQPVERSVSCRAVQRAFPTTSMPFTSSDWPTNTRMGSKLKISAQHSFVYFILKIIKGETDGSHRNLSGNEATARWKKRFLVHSA